MASQTTEHKGFLGRLLRNQAGNTLVITAAATLPLLALVGGGIDMSRLYLVKARLQQACDAGALAGRKAQGGGTWTSATRTTANNIFDTNFAANAYGTGTLSRNFSEHTGTVTGTASVPVPMMIMRIFGFEQKTISVNCDAEMRLPNTDIMFVLDTTGSMADPPASGGSTSKIDGLKTAVQCFYEILMKTDTPANCGSTPSGGVSDDIQIRFGFVPYAVNVNVGKLLPNDFIANNWTYQSRQPNSQTVYAWTAGTESLVSNWGNWSTASNLTDYNSYSNYANVSSNVTLNGTTYAAMPSANKSSTCTSLNSNGGVGFSDSSNIGDPTSTATTPNHPDTHQTITYSQSDSHSYYAYKYVWTNSNNNKCRLQRGTRNETLTRTGRTTTKPLTWTSHEQLLNWTYRPVSWNVSGLKNGGSWNSSINLPVASSTVTVNLSGSNSSSTIATVTNSTVAWDGCIEERQTVRASSYAPIPSDAFDLNIDMIPSTSNVNTQWGPMLPNAVWGRYSNGSNYYPELTTSNNLNRNISSSCPTAARLLTSYRTSAQKDNFVSYINSLSASGNTFHDIGLIWGARLMSPTGIFASDNAFTPAGGEIQRHMIFMTDGDACTNVSNYNAYGIAWWDRRQTPTGTAPTDGCTSTGTLTEQVNARTEALCTAIKNMNVTLWVVNYGGGVSTSTGTRLKNCASTNRYYEATSVPSLMTTFQQIAAQISQLRLTS